MKNFSKSCCVWLGWRFNFLASFIKLIFKFFFSPCGVFTSGKEKAKEHKSKDEAKGIEYWILWSFFTFFFILFIQTYWPGVIPFDTFAFWEKTDIAGGMKASIPIFLWGGTLTLLHSVITYNKPEINRDAEDLLFGGFIVSAIAGIFEEIAFRWLLFFDSIVAVKIFNFLFFGFLGFGLSEFLHNWFLGPIVDFFTLGKMTWLIFGKGWAVGAALIIANAKFRKEHAYLGIFGFFNSWFIGFFLFDIMFEYGMLAVITVHFVYDMIIFIIRYFDAVFERFQGRVPSNIQG